MAAHKAVKTKSQDNMWASDGSAGRTRGVAPNENLPPGAHPDDSRWVAQQIGYSREVADFSEV